MKCDVRSGLNAEHCRRFAGFDTPLYREVVERAEPYRAFAERVAAEARTKVFAPSPFTPPRFMA